MARSGLKVDLVATSVERHDAGNEENAHPLHCLRLASPLSRRQLAGARSTNYRAEMRLLLASTVMLSLVACHNNAGQAPSNNEAASAAGEGIKGVHRDQKSKPAPDASFQDMDGKTVKLASFKGRPVLVNLWATWCAPCVKELPTLDTLARTNAFPVVAISEDTGPHASVLAFLQSHQISTLKAYQDPKMALSSALGPDTVLPTSILLDADGHEVWRYVGDLDWTSPEAAKLLSEAAAPGKAH